MCFLDSQESLKIGPQIQLQDTEGARQKEKKKKKRWATFSTPKVTELQQSGWSYRQREQSFPGSQVSGTQLPHSDA